MNIEIFEQAVNMRIIVCIVRLIRYTWDEDKRQANLLKHDLDFSDAEKDFYRSIVLFEDVLNYFGEQRMIAGLLEYAVVLVENDDEV